MIRIGEIVKGDESPVMKVSANYEKVVRALANLNYPSDETKLLGCLIISQTEYQYKKKATLYLRRLVMSYLTRRNEFTSFQLLLVYFTAAQLLISWESSCIHLGRMVLDGGEIEKMSKEFCEIWPIYYES